MNTTNHINTSNSNPWKLLAPCCVLAAGCLWGIIGLFSNTLRGMGLDPVQITELRSLIAAAGLLIIILHKDRSLFRIHLRDLWMFLGTGIASIAFFNICYFLCITLSTLSIACTLLYTGPCFVMILSCLIFREKFTPKKAIALVLAVGGCTFITGLVSGGAGGVSISWQAILSGLGSGLGYGLYSIFGRVAVKKYSELTVTFYTFVIASLSLLPFCHIGKIAAVASASGFAVLHSLLLGLVSTLAPFLLYTTGLSHMETGKAAVLTFHGDHHKHHGVRRGLHRKSCHRNDRYRDLDRPAQYQFYAPPESLAQTMLFSQGGALFPTKNRTV